MKRLTYFHKMGGGSQCPPAVGFSEILWSWVGAFLGISGVGWMHYHLLPGEGLVFIVGSFGASAVLIYGAVRSPLAQPRNFVGGHLLSAFIGVAAAQIFYFVPWFAASLAVATSIAFMHATRTLHPPGGATALIAVIGGKDIHDLGFFYVLVPVGSGVMIMLVVALLVNNLAKSRKYPEFWF